MKRIKKYLVSLFILSITSIICFLVLSFVNLSFDIRLWNEGSRVAFAIIALIVMFFSWVIQITNND